ncbi:right-handed parallel beta-helix repeat-containing protein [Priestia megaterium]|uniref:right-handed parallel beta-helix repeat-containing protein n=1 Tax=Priestia megaterium TaxID=1404 RepID=UPI002E1A9B75|nr:right-handed parallel beta-helix repeat-containing protein [Priestia megaterium]
MSFGASLPEWKNTGQEPPTSIKEQGWLPTNRPPAEWMNWFFNRTYTALKDIQENAISDTEFEALSNDVGSLSGFEGLNWMTSSTVQAILDMRTWMIQQAINVRLPPYNAKGDGSNETAILQQVFNEARDTGKPIYFPPTYEDKYGVSSLSLDYSNKTIDSSTLGFKSIKIFGNTKRNTKIAQIVDTTDSILKFIGQVGDRSHSGKITGLILEGITLEGRTNGGSGIYLRSFNDIVIRDAYITKCGGDAIRLDRQVFDPTGGKDEYAYNLKIENVKMILNKGWGINSIAQASVGSVLISNCDIQSNTTGGININPSSITILGGNVIGNAGPGLKVRQSPSYPTSVAFALNVYGTRFEGNNVAGGYEITVEGSWSPKFDGVVVLATTGAHVFCFGYGSGTENAVRQPMIIGGYYAGDKKTVGQKFLDIGTNCYGLSVINPRIDVNEFYDAIQSKDMMDTVKDSGTDTYIILSGRNERTPRTLMGKNLLDRALNSKLFEDTTHRFLLRYGGAMEWGNGVDSPDTNLYRSAAGQLRTDSELVVKGPISAGATSAKIYSGMGSPEGVLTAGNASLYQRVDGTTGARLYIKTTGTGNVGWEAIK